MVYQVIANTQAVLFLILIGMSYLDFNSDKEEVVPPVLAVGIIVIQILIAVAVVALPILGDIS